MIKNRRGVTGIEILIILSLLAAAIGGLWGYEPHSSRVVHSGVVTSAHQELAGGAEQTVVEFANGITFTVSGRHYVTPGMTYEIVRTDTGYDIR